MNSRILEDNEIEHMTKNQKHYYTKQKPQREQDKYNREVLVPELKAENFYLESENNILKEKLRSAEEHISSLRRYILNLENKQNKLKR